MPEFSDERARLLEIRERLEDWIVVGREEADEDVFEGPDAPVSEDDLEALARLDSELNPNGDGLWRTDQYGVIHLGGGDEETRPFVVCTSHPQIPEAEPLARSVDDATTDRLNDALWQYRERVVEHDRADLDDFVRDGDLPADRERPDPNQPDPDSRCRRRDPSRCRSPLLRSPPWSSGWSA